MKDTLSKKSNQNPHKLLRVLIVDDNATARSGLKALLESAAHTESKFEILEAADGQAALQLTQELQPDIVFMDVQMPGLNGIEATHLIKQHWPDVKVVILTMYTVPQDEAEIAGADGFLLKGCPPEALFSAIFQ